SFATTAQTAEPEWTEAELDAVASWYRRVIVKEDLRSGVLLFRIDVQKSEENSSEGLATWSLFFDAYRRVLRVMLFYTGNERAEKFTEVYDRHGKLLEFESRPSNGKTSMVALTF